MYPLPLMQPRHIVACSAPPCRTHPINVTRHARSPAHWRPTPPHYGANPYKDEAAHMPYIGIGLHVLAAIYFAVHAIRSGQGLYWLILLFSFPLLGSFVYFTAIYFPKARNSRGARQAIRSAKQLMDPGGTCATRVPNWRVRPPCRIGFAGHYAAGCRPGRGSQNPARAGGQLAAGRRSLHPDRPCPCPPRFRAARACGGDAGRLVRPPSGCAPQAGTDPALRAGTGGCPSARHPCRVRASRGMRK